MSARAEIAAHFTSDTLANQLLDAHRTEVLAEADARFAAMTMPEYLQQTLNAGSYKDAWQACRRIVQTMAEEKTTPASTTTEAAVTPEPDAWQSEDEQRRALLLAEIRTHGGKWTKRRVIKFYRDGGADGPLNARAKRDLHALHVLGALTVNGPQDGRFYLLRKGGNRA